MIPPMFARQKAAHATVTANVDPAVLHAWAAERLTRFKVPRYIELIAELPHTPTGRVAKHQLPRERTAGEWDKENSGKESAGG